MKLQVLVVVVAIGTSLTACGKKENPVQTSGSPPLEVTATAPAAPDRNTPPAPVPATHDLAAQPAAPAAPTAQDTAAQQPLKDLTAAESASSLPKSGQVNNHSSTALDDANKASSSSSPTVPSQGTPATATTK